MTDAVRRYTTGARDRNREQPLEQALEESSCCGGYFSRRGEGVLDPAVRTPLVDA